MYVCVCCNVQCAQQGSAAMLSHKYRSMRVPVKSKDGTGVVLRPGSSGTQGDGITPTKFRSNGCNNSCEARKARCQLIIRKRASLNVSVASVADDASKLHDKLKRKGAVEKSNLAIVKDLQSISSQRITSFQEMMNENNKVQNGLLEDSSRVVGDLLAEQDGHLENLTAKIGSLKGDMEAFASSAVNLVQEEFTTKAGGVLKEVVEMQQANCKDTAEIGERVLTSATKNLGKVEESIQKSKELPYNEAFLTKGAPRPPPPPPQLLGLLLGSMFCLTVPPLAEAGTIIMGNNHTF